MNQQHFFLLIQGKLKPINAGSILLIESDSNYSHVHTKEQVYTIIVQLHALERKLPSELFCRVHRQYIIGIKHITYVSKDYVGIADRHIPIGEKYSQHLFNKLVVLK